MDKGYLKPLQFETIVDYSVGESQKVSIQLPNTYWNRFFLQKSADRLARLRIVYERFNRNEDAYRAYFKGKLYECALHSTGGTFKCEDPDFRDVLVDRPEYFQQILDELIKTLIVQFNDDLGSIIDPGISQKAT